MAQIEPSSPEEANTTQEEEKPIEVEKNESKEVSHDNRNANHSNSSNNSQDTSTETYEITYYSAYCPTCGEWGGITATGYDISNTITYEGMGIIAVDPSMIPLRSIVEVDGTAYIALDTGGAIKGRRIDILVESTERAYQLGRHNAQVKVLQYK